MSAIEESERASVPWDSPVVRVVLASTLLAPLGVPLVSPALPVIRDAFGVTDAAASLLITAYFLTGIVLSPFLGMLADRIGRRRVLVGSLLVFGLSGGAVALADSFATVLALRVISGTAAAGIFVTTVTILGDAFEGVQRNAVLGANTAVLSTGAAAFPIVGGALVAFGWNAPFLTYLLAVPLAVVAWYALTDLEHDTNPENGGATRYLRGVAGSLVASGTAVYYVATFAAELLFFGAVLTTLPFLLTGTFALSPVLVGLTLTVAEVAAIAVAAANGRFAERVRNGPLVAAGFVCLATGLGITWLATGLGTAGVVAPLVIGAGVLFVGAGAGLVLPSVDAEVSRLVPTQFRAGALSLRNSATFLGRAAGPVVFAGIAITTGYATLLLIAGVASLVCAVVLAVVTGRVVEDVEDDVGGTVDDAVAPTEVR
ncbi:MFS transporter [Haloprofundus marisrubri]|uniref:MFS transporter n=1 Tax=Haloprofundus marisrubri TaxID=1514971 RepID=UPI0008F831EE|nr:MFS transporter [Haloprofundus marisrubri]